MVYTLDEQSCRNLGVSSRREWLLTNGIGGYAMGTVSGMNTRRYHGLLVAATTPPTGRMLLLSGVDASIQTDATPVGISTNQYPGTIYPEGYQYLTGFTAAQASVTWRFRATGADVVRKLTMHPGTNAVTLEHQNLGVRPVLLTLRPLVAHRDHHSDFIESGQYPESVTFPRGGTVVTHGGVSLYIRHEGAQRMPVHGWYYRFEHFREAERGLNPRDDLFCPCELRYELRPGESAVLVISDQPDTEPMVAPVEEPIGFVRLTPMLQQAAERFIVETPERTSILAGYPWFTDWGRDTMIALPGVCLHTGRVADARAILHDYARALHHGLLPNRFTEGGQGIDTNTVDATLWFANSIYKTLQAEWEEPFAREMFTVLKEVFGWHRDGTDFGIKMDPADGLLTQGAEGVQLTWMDAKVGDWVVTPRHGKPVEINGLWINMLRVILWLADQLQEQVAEVREAVAKAEISFELKFWHEVRGHYLDTVEPADASLRPNQVIAMAVPFSPCDPDHARRALSVVTRELLTPVGLRTLGPNEPHYRGKFEGPLAELDASYHQGTVWPWLLGSYLTALVRLTGDRKEAKRIARQAKEMLLEYGLGGIAEVYDGDGPQNPGGCPWQAWSVGELLRAWVEDCGGD